jgi:hypothetical protein
LSKLETLILIPVLIFRICLPQTNWKSKYWRILVIQFFSDGHHLLLFSPSCMTFQSRLHGIAVHRFSSTTVQWQNLLKKQKSGRTPLSKRKEATPTGKKASCGSSNLPDDVLPNAIQCTKVPSGTRLNIEALKNTGILSQILTEIIEKDGECKQKEKGRPSAFERI